MLRSLIDALLSELRKAQRQARKHSQRRASSRPHNAAQQHWQLQAASIVAVISETLYGASMAWQPSHGSTAAQQHGRQHMADDVSMQSPSRSAMDELQALVILVEEEWVREPLWGLPTAIAASWQQERALVQQLTPQACPSQERDVAGVLACDACSVAHDLWV